MHCAILLGVESFKIGKQLETCVPIPYLIACAEPLPTVLRTVSRRFQTHWIGGRRVSDCCPRSQEARMRSRCEKLVLNAKRLQKLNGRREVE